MSGRGVKKKGGGGEKPGLADAALELLAERGYQPEFGARPLRRTLQRLLDDRLAAKLLDGTLTKGQTVRATVTDGQLDLQVV